MKQVINGKLYDTDKAELVSDQGGSPGEVSVTDFNWFHESLYRTGSGKFFIHGEGNARSPYAVAVGNNTWSGSEKIQPLTDDEAIHWLMRNDQEALLRIFGDRIEEA